MQKFNRFIYDSWSFDQITGELSLKYSLDEQIFFTETILFPVEKIDLAVTETKAFAAAVEGLWIMAGISYFKATLASQIIFKNYDLQPEQKKFFEKIFLHGLGEFFYVNDIDPNGKINFPNTLNQTDEGIPKNVKTLHVTSLPDQKIPHTNKSLPTNAKILLPIGGGKDSLVSAKLLEKSGLDYRPWMVGETQIQHDCCTKLGKNPLVIQRKICPNLIKLNKDGALNGHVPISAIWAFLSIVTAILTDHTHVVLSNEASANVENLEFKGLKINHQYSKSLEFEQDFQNYVEQFINNDCHPELVSGSNPIPPKPVHYFSLLRNLREIDIAKIFAEVCWDEFKHVFASCNRNFTLSKKNSLHKKQQNKWCCSCPKCAFVFLILSPFVDRDELIETFGENLFIKLALKNTFDELLGLSGHKPLECVGEIEECREALHGAKKNWSETGNWLLEVENPKKNKEN